MTEVEEERPNVSYGNVELAQRHEILRTVVGSGVHGIAIEGFDDRDEMGVFIEPVEHVVGMAEPMNVAVYRTQPEGMRSQPGDLDLNLYSMRKYLRLAAVGNPTALLPLWCPEESVLQTTEIGQALRGMRDAFMSQAAVERFLAYMLAQHDRMMGRGKRGSVPNRPELIEKYGFDVKFAAHALRLAYQGYEICLTGQLSLPLPEDPRAHVLAVKRGEVPRREVSRTIIELTQITKGVLENGTPLPERPDWAKIGEFSVDAHVAHWGLGEPS